MNHHQAFFGTVIKRNSKQINSKKDDKSFNNKLFENDNLRKLHIPKQLLQQYCVSLEHGVKGIRLETKSPQKQIKELENSKQNIENTSIYPETLKFSFNQQFQVQDLNSLIKTRRCQLERGNLHSKQKTLELQCPNLLISRRQRAQSFAEERCFSPNPKNKKTQLNSIIYRNLQCDSFRLQENQSENY